MSPRSLCQNNRLEIVRGNDDDNVSCPSASAIGRDSRAGHLSPQGFSFPLPAQAPGSRSRNSDSVTFDMPAQSLQTWINYKHSLGLLPSFVLLREEPVTTCAVKPEACKTANTAKHGIQQHIHLHIKSDHAFTSERGHVNSTWGCSSTPFSPSAVGPDSLNPK